MQRLGAELGQDEDLLETGMDAVADREVDQAEPAGNGDGGFAPDLGQRVQPAALSSGHDDCHNVLHVKGSESEKTYR